MGAPHVMKLSARALFASCLFLTFPAAVQSKSDTNPPTPRNIEITVQPLHFQLDAPKKSDFGPLQWRGGFSITSISPDFGGFSGLAISTNGKHLLAVSDAGAWMLAELGYKGSNLASISKTKLGPLTGRNAKPLIGKDQSDAESIALQPGKFFGATAFVSFERQHRITPYQITSSGLKAKPRPSKLPINLKKLKENQGLEAIEFIRGGKRKGTLIALAERFKDKAGNLKGWMIRQGKAKKLKIKRLKEFDITGLAALPDGSMILLERKFRFSEGVQMRLRRFTANSIKPGKLLEGETLMEVRGRDYNIDNMEGIAVHRSKNGETIITLISDDNFNAFQRTLIMQFALSGKAKKSK